METHDARRVPPAKRLAKRNPSGQAASGKRWSLATHAKKTGLTAGEAAAKTNACFKQSFE
ncbi:MAG: hypothetical protein ABGY13_07825 [Verrucomicrobiia bacterium]